MSMALTGYKTFVSTNIADQLLNDWVIIDRLGIDIRRAK